MEEVAGSNEVIMVVEVIGEEAVEEEGVREAEAEVELKNDRKHAHTIAMRCSKETHKIEAGTMIKSLGYARDYGLSSDGNRI